MKTHDSIVSCYNKIGYPSTRGVCYGISIRWLEACFLGEEDKFYERIKRIEQIVSSKSDIVQLVEAVKNKKGQHLSTQDWDLLDILAFFDSIAVYQSPDKYSELLNISYRSAQLNTEFHSQVASSDNIRTSGGFAKVYSKVLIPNKMELMHYLDDLSVFLQTTTDVITGFTFLQPGHALALSFKPGIGWSIMDIEKYPAEILGFDTSLVAQKIMNSWLRHSKPNYVPYGITVYALKNPQFPLLKRQLKNFKIGSSLTKDQMLREQDKVGLAYMAALQGHSSLIAELTKNGADLNLSPNSYTPAYIAAQEGYASVIAELGKGHADLNKKSGVGCFTPAYIAAAQGHVSVITELAQYHADLNKTNLWGDSPVRVAASNGYPAVIAELAKHGADLNKTTFLYGTPAFIAAEKGYVSVIRELAKYHADLNRAFRGLTPAHAAAKNGHTAIIAELAKNKADLNKKCKYGFTPIHYAALQTDIKVFTELLKHGVDLSPSFLSVQKLRELSKSQAGTQMKIFLDQHNGKKEVLLSPYEIAVLMGHKMPLEQWGENAIHSYIIKRSQECNKGFLPKSIIYSLKRIGDLKTQKETIESKLKAVETLLKSIKNNDECIAGRKYYWDFIKDNKAEYDEVMSHIPDIKKAPLLQSAELLAKPDLSSSILHGMSWATCLLSVGYRMLIPQAQQDYLISMLPQTLDGECKANLKQLVHECRDVFKNELQVLDEKINHLNKKIFNKNREVVPHLSILPAQSVVCLSSVLGMIHSNSLNKLRNGFFKNQQGPYLDSKATPRKEWVPNEINQSTIGCLSCGR